MKCPNCESELDTVVLTDKYYQTPVPIEQCENCGGVWLGDKELNKISEIGIKSQSFFKKEDYARDKYRNEQKCCPIDNTPLIKLMNGSFIDRLNFEICPKCQGIWTSVYDVKRFYQEKKDRVEKLRPKENPIEFLEAGDIALDMLRYGQGDLFGQITAEYKRNPVNDPYRVSQNTINMIRKMPEEQRRQVYQDVINNNLARNKDILMSLGVTRRIFMFTIGLLRAFL